jgi:hypothetical protein
MKILFICKKRIIGYGVSTGLYNSATFVSNALNYVGVESKVVSAVDNNSIDKEVHDYDPDLVVIEAFWVVPSKFEILCSLYPDVQWVVRSHSKIPFFANEGIAMKWTWGYKEIANKYSNFHISFNDRETSRCLCRIFKEKIIYLPNIYYPCEYDLKASPGKNYDHIHIGCFGAIRPLKNNLIQAIAAIQFVNNIKKKLFFHINGTRLEQDGGSVLKNLEHLFSDVDHELVEHTWMHHEGFIDVVRTMDIGMQVSLSESFNIVSADFIANWVPMVVSPDISWVSVFSQADPNRVKSIVKALHRVRLLRYFGLNGLNRYYLEKHNRKSVRKWMRFLIGFEK